MPALLKRIAQLIEADPRPRSITELRRQLRSTIRDTRLLALARIRKQIEATGLRSSYFELAKPITVDRDSTCRWQATIILGEFIETEPDRVWKVARELGTSANADIRMASATVLLEHLLEYHAATMVPLFRAELRRREPRFADAVASCWNCGSGRSKPRIQRIIDEACRLRSNQPPEVS